MIVKEQEVVKERKWVNAARAGDKRAFDALFRAHQKSLRAFLRQRVGGQVEEDILQETFLAAWEAMPHLNLKTRFKSWLLAIAVHKIADHHRSQGRRYGRETPLEVADSVVSEGRNMTSGFVRTENRDLARVLLAPLSDEQRQVIKLYYFAELTLPEIAVALDRNLNTVKYIFYRAHTVAAEKKSSDMLFEPSLPTALSLHSRGGERQNTLSR
jgi:RNA polymerase sigma-70 factor (ECF subfamily)